MSSTVLFYKVERIMGAEELQQWFTTEEAAKYLRTSASGIRSAIMRGKLRPDTFGRQGKTAGHRFSRPTLDAYLTGKKR